jgi:hypothetical protein
LFGFQQRNLLFNLKSFELNFFQMESPFRTKATAFELKTLELICFLQSLEENVKILLATHKTNELTLRNPGFIQN